MAENEEAFDADVQQGAQFAWKQNLDMNDGKSTDTDTYISSTGTDTMVDDQEQEEEPLLLSDTNGHPSGDAPTGKEDKFSKPWTLFEGLPWYKKPSIFWILPAFFPFCLSWGGTIVPKTYLILNLICRSYLEERTKSDPSFKMLPLQLGGQNEQCRDANVQSRVAQFQLYSSLLSGIFSALVSPYLGSLSDRIGRKKVMLFASSGFFLDLIITTTVGTYPDKLSVYWMLVGSLLDGLCGSFTMSLGIALAYATDCTSPNRRNVALGYFHGILFSGLALGPILAGGLMKWADSILIAFYFALGCYIFFFLFISLLVPESVVRERQVRAEEKYRIKKHERRDEKWRNMMTISNLLKPFSIFNPKDTGSGGALRRNLILLASIDTIMFGVAMGTMGVILIYPQYVFGWDEMAASQYLSIVNTCRCIALFIVLPTITRLVRGPVKATDKSAHSGSDMLDIRIIRVAIFLDMIGYIGYATAMSGWMMVVSGMIAAFGGMGSPTLGSAITSHVPAEKTGQVLGALSLLHALARVVSPLLFNTIYSLTVGVFTSAVFVALGSLFLVVFVLSWFLKPGISYENTKSSQASENEDGPACTC